MGREVTSMPIHTKALFMMIVFCLMAQTVYGTLIQNNYMYHNGEDRNYTIYVPPALESVTDGKYPLLLVICIEKLKPVSDRSRIY